MWIRDARCVPTGPSCQEQPLQSPLKQQGPGTASGEAAELLPNARPPPSSQPLASTSPPPSVSRQGPDCGQTSLTLGRGTEANGSSERGMGAEMGRESGRGGTWSWTVDEPRCNAQWVRRKQEYRSTRPW
ncbi:hypothetical protein AGOR_G00044760 [Albula goreensis]|uniref:Uncharacterized protein n=1 Tax=Albula goreensis TaxID=1534307 RepID=A0A8T3E6H9_9TELE|nr:hypothetical protein AGOR_G00044760 [Albula goreensis]